MERAVIVERTWMCGHAFHRDCEVPLFPLACPFVLTFCSAVDSLQHPTFEDTLFNESPHTQLYGDFRTKRQKHEGLFAVHSSGVNAIHCLVQHKWTDSSASQLQARLATQDAGRIALSNAPSAKSYLGAAGGHKAFLAVMATPFVSIPAGLAASGKAYYYSIFPERKSASPIAREGINIAIPLMTPISPLSPNDPYNLPSPTPSGFPDTICHNPPVYEGGGHCGRIFRPVGHPMSTPVWPRNYITLQRASHTSRSSNPFWSWRAGF
ncbi:hypothetical protein J6590_054387 [Homalodisca vitripennis]|nr:hypothetical protein J6590_054387 [Homalodisca vitripennis]